MPEESGLSIDILYTQQCPHVNETRQEIQRALEHAGVEKARVSVHEVRSEEEAREKGFIGSPTVFVNGRDIEENTTEEGPHLDVCREYTGEGGAPIPYPPLPAIEHAIARALTGSMRPDAEPSS